MIPKLYDSFDVVNQNYGQGYRGKVSRCSKCLVTEVRNGSYTLELETNVNDPTADLLISQRVLAVKPNPHDPIQYFEIQNTERDLSGIIKVTASHVKLYPCNLVSGGSGTRTDDLQTEHSDPEGIWYILFNDSYITSPTAFTFDSDITTEADFYLGFNEAKTLGAILGGEEGSMVDMYGGELYYDNYRISLQASRGKISSYKLRYGQNISSAKQSETSLEAYSHILPYGTATLDNGKTIYISANVVEIPNNECQTYKVFPIDCSDAITVMLYPNTGVGRDEARQQMTDYALSYAKTNNIGKRSVSIDITAQAELDGMLSLGLCDTVKVVLDNYGIQTTAKISSVTYNVLLERWEKMTVGTAKLSLSDLILNRRRYKL